MRRALAGLAMLAAGTAVAGEDPQVVAADIDGGTVTVFLQDFLTDEEAALLQLVLSNDEARALFIPEGKGSAAMAVAPKEGLIRKGAPVASAQAVAGLPDIGTARAQALAACNAARKRGPACVVVLEVATK